MTGAALDSDVGIGLKGILTSVGGSDWLWVYGGGGAVESKADGEN